MKRSATYLLGVLLLLAAGSCSVQKKCKAPQLDMPAEIVAGQSDTLTLSDRKWWEVYTCLLYTSPEAPSPGMTGGVER